MGILVVEETGGLLFRWVGLGLGSELGIFSEDRAAALPESATVFVGRLVGATSELLCFGLVCAEAGFGVGNPDMTGGGSSSPSVAFFDNCRAKSDACHHSKNFSANIEVGRRILRLESRRGYTTEVKVLGLNRLDA